MRRKQSKGAERTAGREGPGHTGLEGLPWESAPAPEGREAIGGLEQKTHTSRHALRNDPACFGGGESD